MKTWLEAMEIKNRKFIQKTLCVCVLTSEKTNWLQLLTGSIWHIGRR